MDYVLWIVAGAATAAVVRRVHVRHRMWPIAAFAGLVIGSLLRARETGASSWPIVLGVVTLAVSIYLVSARSVAGDALAGRRRRTIFISYRTATDAILARAVAERLLASGVGVWFSEYEVDLARYDHWSLLMEEGIANAIGGLALIRPQFLESDHCRRELELMLDRFGPEGILFVEVALDGGATVDAYPAAAAAERVRSGDCETIVAEIRRLAPFVVPPEPPSRVTHTGTVVEGSVLGIPYRLPADGWLVEPAAQLTMPDGEVQGPSLRLADSENVVQCNVFAGPQKRELIRLSDYDGDDVALRRATMRQARRHYGNLGVGEERGQHLLPHRDFGQFAITYRMPGYWSRKYSVVLEAEPGQGVEFVFTFGVNGTFARFCSVAHHMDTLVSGLEWSRALRT